VHEGEEGEAGGAAHGGAEVSAFRKSFGGAADAAGKAVLWGWRIGPAVAGMGAVSAGIGGIVQTFAGGGGVWAGLVVAGVFGIAIDLKG
jgi:hypothetical protein